MTELVSDAPDLEDLAAYLDGSLSDERRALVEERLARDEDYYDVFMETVRFQEEQSQEEGDGNVIAPPWFRNWKTLAPMAVAATLVAALGWRLLTFAPSPSEWVAKLDVVKLVQQENWADPGWARFRSHNISQGFYQPEELAFRIGLRTVDLRVAITAEDQAAVRQLAKVLEEFTEAANLVEESVSYREFSRQVGTVETETLINQAAEIESLLEQSYRDEPVLLAQRFRLGAWTEAGRLAALVDDSETLFRVFEDRHRHETTERTAGHLKDLEDILSQDELYDPDFEAAEQAFRGIARDLAGRG